VTNTWSAQAQLRRVAQCTIHILVGSTPNNFLAIFLVALRLNGNWVLPLAQRDQLRYLLHHCVPVPQAGTRPLREAGGTVLGA
jgi:hypothetical protein